MTLEGTLRTNEVRRNSLINAAFVGNPNRSTSAGMELCRWNAKVGYFRVGESLCRPKQTIKHIQCVHGITFEDLLQCCLAIL